MKNSMKATTVRISEVEKESIFDWLSINNKGLKEKDRMKLSEIVHLFLYYSIKNLKIENGVLTLKNGSKSDSYSMSDNDKEKA
jgi:alkyl sulfatase BDS1-like metallo-beta-lactamase superfamily hydrolase